MSGYEVLTGSVTIGPHGFNDVRVPCSAGKHVLSGGWVAAVGNGILSAQESFPDVGNTAWTFGFLNPGAGNDTQNVYVICAFT
jgi:hypothetical protein